jgi:1,2-diacylglycerol 3-beta-galactosyltransferase
MVVSVHPLTQVLPLKILKHLDGGETRTTPFVTVVTDLGGASKSWFHPE